LLSYNNLYEIFISTNLFLVGFIAILLKIIVEVTESQRDIADSGFLTKKAEVKVVLAIIAFLLAFVPVREVRIDDIVQYKRQCEIDGTVATIDQNANSSVFEFEGDSGGIPVRDFDILVSNRTIRIPLMLDLAMALGRSVSLQATSNLPCSINIIALSETVLETRITEPDLLSETKDFLNTCYEPALYSGRKDDRLPWVENPDSRDIPWPGHRSLFNDLYYSNITDGFVAQRLIDGYQGSPNNQNVSNWRDSAATCEGPFCIHERGGYPTCREWWDGVGAGFDDVGVSSGNQSLRSRLLAGLPEFMGVRGSTQMRNALQGLSDQYEAGANTSLDDELIHTALFTQYGLNKIQNAETRDFGSLGEGAGSILNEWTSRIFGTVGSSLTAVGDFAEASIIQLAAPLAQGLVIFMLISILPVAIIVSSFDWKFIFKIHVIIFTVMLWPYLWDLIILTQQSYIESVYANSSPFALLDLTNINSKLVVLRLTDVAFVAVPLFVSAIISLAGFSGANAVTGSVGSGASAASGASKGASKVKGAASKFKK
jgi:hypothetical protein